MLHILISTKSVKKILFILSQGGIGIILVITCIISGILSPFFFYPQNWVNILRSVSILGTLSMGATFVILTGGIDLTVGTAVVLVSLVIADLLVWGIAIPIAIIGGVAVGLSLGCLNGLLITKGKIQPFIVTLGMMMIIRGVGYFITGGGHPTSLTLLPKNTLATYGTIGRGSIGPLPVVFYVFFIVFLISWFILRKTSFGRCVYCIGTNAKSSYLAGINVNAYTIIAYGIAGVFTGIGSTMWLSRLQIAVVGYAEDSLFDVIGAVVIGGTSLAGGKGGALQTLMGIILLCVLSNILNLMGVSSFVQLMLKGVFIIGAVAIDQLRA